MTMSNAPVQCRSRRGDYGSIWEIVHRGTLVAFFRSGDEALRYLDAELTRWEQRERGKALARKLVSRYAPMFDTLTQVRAQR